MWAYSAVAVQKNKSAREFDWFSEQVLDDVRKFPADRRDVRLSQWLVG